MTKPVTKKPQLKHIHVFKTIFNNNNCAFPPLPLENKAICFYQNAITDEELVRCSNYKFNLDPIKILVNDSEKSRFAQSNKKRYVKKVPRRQNAWILYRRDKCVNFGGLKSAHTSKLISEMWSKEPRETVELFEALARIATKKHIEKHGTNYKYIPKKSTQRKGRITPASADSSLELRINPKQPPDSTISQFSTNIYLAYYTN